MSRSNFERPFKVTKEIDIGTLEALIEACMRPRSLVVDMNCGAGHYKTLRPLLLSWKLHVFF